MTQMDMLCFKVLSAKYFLDGDVFRYKQGDRPSHGRALLSRLMRLRRAFYGKWATATRLILGRIIGGLMAS